MLTRHLMINEISPNIFSPFDPAKTGWLELAGEKRIEAFH
jgi:hypothetical protein